MSTQVLEQFQFEDKQVRTIMQDGEPWFVLADVCKVLGLRTDNVKPRLNSEDVNTHYIAGGIGNPNKTIVNESGLYDVILDSRKPQAREFRRWITSSRGCGITRSEPPTLSQLWIRCWRLVPS